MLVCPLGTGTQAACQAAAPKEDQSRSPGLGPGSQLSPGCCWLAGGWGARVVSTHRGSGEAFALQCQALSQNSPGTGRLCLPTHPFP